MQSTLRDSIGSRGRSENRTILYLAFESEVGGEEFEMVQIEGKLWAFCRSTEL